jgi:hypothetical protein
VQELNMGWGFSILQQLPLDATIPAPQLLSLLSQAATNLAACPACMKQPQRFGLHLAGTLPALTPQQRVQLFAALAPLRAIQLQHLRIDSPLELGLPEVEALAHSLGDSIRSVELLGCILTSSFWMPFVQQFPHLQQLRLGSEVAASAIDVSFFLTMCSQARPDNLTINISKDLLSKMGCADLQAHIAAWQLQNIHVV